MLAENDLAARQAAEIAAALAHPVRLQILALLAQGGAYVMDLTAALGRRQANISQHLAVLRAAGLVQAEREGMAVRYSLRSAKILQVLDLLQALGAALPTETYPPEGRWRRRRCRGRCR